MTTGILGAWGPALRIAAHKPRITRAPIVPDNLVELVEALNLFRLVQARS